MTKLKSIKIKTTEYTLFKKGNIYTLTCVYLDSNQKIKIDKLHFFDELVAEGVWADITLRVEAETQIKRGA